jgi:wyosine [tRNA(Phe)-imidazoG37] synthetase (radical SAM superfamily)
MKEEIEKGISEHLRSGKTIDYITICGNGEATDYPYFVDVARFLLELRPRLFPEVPVAILTNSANVHREEVAEIISKFDVSFFKLDAGDEETFRTINRPLAGTIGFRQIVDGLKKVERLNLQTAVVRSPRVSNIPSLKGPFIGLLKELKPLAVYIHNIDYPTPDPTIERLELEEMVELGRFIAGESGTPVRVLHSLISLRG